jgi:peptide/nickel transport system substrate-binding protein
MPRLRSLILLAALGVGSGCAGTDRGAGGGEGAVGGTLVIATTSEPNTLLPPAMYYSSEAQIADQIFDGLADLGPDLNTAGDAGFTPRVARSWTWSADSLSIAFHLDPRARFHDGAPVRAGDVRFSLALYKDPTVGSPAASALADVDSISVTDSVTATAWFHHRSPEQFYSLVYNVRVLPEHLLRDVDRTNIGASDFARHPVGSGPFRFVRWEPRAVVEIAADTGYFLGRPRLDRIIWNWSGDEAAAVTKLRAGEADFIETVSTDAISQVARDPHLRTVRYRLLNYGYLIFNFLDPADPSRPHPVLTNAALRRALSMALDRQAMVTNVLDTLGRVGVGPYPSDYAVADPDAPRLPYDTVRADRMLDSLGWRDTNGDGYRERNGLPLRFSLLTPATSAFRQRYAELLQEQWRRVGVRLDIDLAEQSVAMAKFRKGQFDMLINSINSDPSPSAIRESWTTRRNGEGAYNFGGFSDPVVDALADSATSDRDAARAQGEYRRAYQRIIEDAPAIWLYENEPHAALRDRLHATFDRSASWWFDLRSWWVSADTATTSG